MHSYFLLTLSLALTVFVVFPHFTDREAEATWGCGTCPGHTATVRQMRSENGGRGEWR